ncbi:hypothetical protein A0O34_12865 [Chryseobacterium glaciei]|uniref:Uncharacterized protein n=1 Tax=Chryseobacterium glaciei TaxID=1685010 RepID=A0A172XWG0_9FLAO|nr:hypothetical protein [Chryseobacterium glaciei]ANF51347.1 hypothetical protein A0O34_12865 [Chryseobacterium glaciei]
MKKLIIVSTLALIYSCGDKYEAVIIYKTTIPPSMHENISETNVDINADSDRKAKIQFVTSATIYNNVSQDIMSEFISGKLLKNNKPISYELEQITIDSINNSIKKLTSHRNGYFNPYIQKQSPN